MFLDRQSQSADISILHLPIPASSITQQSHLPAAKVFICGFRIYQPESRIMIKNPHQRKLREDFSFKRADDEQPFLLLSKESTFGIYSKHKAANLHMP